MSTPLDTPEDERALRRIYLVGLACMAALVVAFAVYRAGEPARRAAALAAMREGDIALGREAYALHCASCHGAAGRGGRGMPTLAATELLSAVSDAQLHALIAYGLPGTTMGAYALDRGGPFTAQHIDRVVAYLRSLEATAGSVPGWREGAPAPGPEAPIGAANEVDAAALYASHCAMCHGAEGAVGTAIALRLDPLPAPYDADLDALVTAIAEGVPTGGMRAFGEAAGGPLAMDEVRALSRWLQRDP
jgi:mono/diheme cytochrome c family protein